MLVFLLGFNRYIFPWKNVPLTWLYSCSWPSSSCCWKWAVSSPWMVGAHWNIWRRVSSSTVYWVKKKETQLSLLTFHGDCPWLFSSTACTIALMEEPQQESLWDRVSSLLTNTWECILKNRECIEREIALPFLVMPITHKYFAWVCCRVSYQEF